MEIRLKDGQSLLDLSIEAYGAWEGSIDLSLSSGISITDSIATGQSFSLPEVTYRKVMQDYCHAHSIAPATATNGVTLPLRIHNGVFSLPFK